MAEDATQVVDNTIQPVEQPATGGVVRDDASVTDTVSQITQDYKTQVQETGQAVVDTVNEGNQTLGRQIGEITDSLQVLSQSQEDNNRILAKLSDRESGSQVTTVAIADNQWQEMRQSWLWAKSAASVALFLCLVVTCLVSAMLGTRLWSAFSKGWRN